MGAQAPPYSKIKKCKNVKIDQLNLNHYDKERDIEVHRTDDCQYRYSDCNCPWRHELHGPITNQGVFMHSLICFHKLYTFYFLFSTAFFFSLANLRSTFFTSSSADRFSGTIPRSKSIFRTAALLSICSLAIIVSPCRSLV